MLRIPGVRTAEAVLKGTPGQTASFPDRVANVMFARRPDFVIIGTGRSGTTFSSKHFTKAGVIVSHEQYYTANGPYLRNPYRDHRARGESSWLAVPYLPDPEMIAIHQVRHPYDVITSFYSIGFFDDRFAEGRSGFVKFAKEHFVFSEEPLHSCLRWYIEWNERCEAITDKRFQVEQFGERADEIESWLGLKVGLKNFATSNKVNTRAPLVDPTQLDVAREIVRYPEYPRLVEMCERYGYTLTTSSSAAHVA